jgi:hypothetical protein
MTTRTNGRDWAKKMLFQEKDEPARKTERSPSAPEIWLGRLRLGESQAAEPYNVYPVCLEDEGPAPQLLLTHQAIAAQVLEIVEEGEGDVQALTARNTGKQPVVVLEGDTLVGCKQNRVVARSVILAAGADVIIPVGCMEQGRWSWKTGRFGAGAMRMSPTMRSGTTREMLAAKKRHFAKARLDQGRLWEDVDAHLTAACVASPTSDYHSAVEEKGREHRERAARVLQRQPGQVGVLVMAEGHFLGLELAGHPATWDELADRTLPAFLMDPHWVDQALADRPGPGRSAEDWLSLLQETPLTSTKGLGLGQEVDLEAPGLGGSGLWHDDQMIHMAVFAC